MRVSRNQAVGPETGKAKLASDEKATNGAPPPELAGMFLFRPAATPKIAVVVQRLTPRLSTKLSENSVPTTLISTTTSQ